MCSFVCSLQGTQMAALYAHTDIIEEAGQMSSCIMNEMLLIRLRNQEPIYWLHDEKRAWVGSVNRVLGQSLNMHLQARQREKHESDKLLSSVFHWSGSHDVSGCLSNTHTHKERKTPAPDFSYCPVISFYWFVLCFLVWAASGNVLYSLTVPHTHRNTDKPGPDWDYLSFSAV